MIVQLIPILIELGKMINKVFYLQYNFHFKKKIIKIHFGLKEELLYYYKMMNDLIKFINILIFSIFEY